MIPRDAEPGTMVVAAEGWRVPACISGRVAATESLPRESRPGAWTVAVAGVEVPIASLDPAGRHAKEGPIG